MSTAVTTTKNGKKNNKAVVHEPEPPVEEIEEAAAPEEDASIPVEAGPSPQKIMHRIQGRMLGLLDRTYGADDESKLRVVRAVAALLGDSSMPTT